ncbi:unannotated protein [freshwater metagenome]|uniref:Unannotated protein n=1 Tax=freshwater metagenome TaxID=449393 RepID=A0A6J7IEP1_9ZZZZ|nr:hypothetical protein [Actinomycetota bacterium]
MSAPSRLQALQLIAFGRHTSAAALAQATDWPEAQATDLLAELAGEGLLDESGRITDAGRAAVTGLLTAERAQTDLAALGALYERFQRTNDKLKHVVTAWQLREGEGDELIPNDHSDPDYDDEVRERLARLDASFGPVLDEMIELVPRWDVHRHRFDTALAQIDGGDDRYIASPLLDSYHTVWFELHEELMQVQAIDRLAEETHA